MAALTNYAENAIIDAKYRGVALVWPAVIALAFILATRGYSSNIRNAVANVGDTVIPTTANGRLYKCTVGGTCAAGEPAWPLIAGATVADGTATWTEQTTNFEAGIFTEVSNAGNYTRGVLNPSLANWAGTQAAGSTAASTGSSGTTSNNAAITFGSAAPSANWGLIFGMVDMDSATYGAGNAWGYCALNAPKTVNLGDPQPSLLVGSLLFQIDN